MGLPLPIITSWEYLWRWLSVLPSWRCLQDPYQWRWFQNHRFFYQDSNSLIWIGWWQNLWKKQSLGVIWLLMLLTMRASLLQDLSQLLWADCTPCKPLPRILSLISPWTDQVCWRTRWTVCFWRRRCSASPQRVFQLQAFCSYVHPPTKFGCSRSEKWWT